MCTSKTRREQTSGGIYSSITSVKTRARPSGQKHSDKKYHNTVVDGLATSGFKKSPPTVLAGVTEHTCNCRLVFHVYKHKQNFLLSTLMMLDF